MEIIKAEKAGFCFGVSNAVNKAFETLEQEREQGAKVYSYGPLIHNDAVVTRLKKAGLSVIENAEEDMAQIKPGSVVVIRAHGVAPQVYEKITEAGCRIVDTTCVFVQKIHSLVEQRYKAGDQVVIIGDASHPEVIGINGWCGNTAIIIDSVQGAQEAVPELKKAENTAKNLSIVAQTTFSKKIFAELVNFFKNTFDKVVIFDTICNATSLRQQEALRIASDVDLMVIVGGRNSSNTRKLYDLSREICDNVILVEDASELNVANSRKYFKVGVTAGASTPDWIIEEVISTMSEVNSTENNVVEEIKNVVETEEITTEEVAVETVVEEEIADEGSFADLLEDSLKTVTSGEIIKGKISKIDVKGVYVDLGFKFEGFIAIDEFVEVPGEEPTQLNIGDEVEAMVVKVSDKDGEAILSKRRVDNKKNMNIIEDSFANKTPVSVKVTEAIKGGVIAYLGSVRIFVPSSQLSERFIKNINSYVGKNIDIVITAFEKGPRGRVRIVGSRKIILAEEREKKEELFWGDVYQGKEYTGTVKSLTPFGAFVNLGGFDGLIHINELSWKRIEHPQEVLKVGQTVDVTIKEFDREKKRISLGYRKEEDNPWFDAENLYQVGDILEVTVTRFVSFGVFVSIKPGVDGLVHISQISNVRLSSAEDCLKLGQKVMAKIIDTNIAEKRINLSIRDVQAYDPEPKAVAADESGEAPVATEKKERPRRKERSERNNDKKKEVVAEPKDEIPAAEPSSMTIGDILASKLQSVPEVDSDDK